MGILTITRIPPEGGKKQEMVAAVYQGSGLKLVGDGSSHHYKDPSERGGRSKRWLHLYIKDLGLKVPKCEIFDRSDFNDFYTIKSLREGDCGVKI